ncbi:hypothetical protein MPTK1_4g14910 [Marchantia polymorpha subsp. ruderalis]|uniref:Secreted protein n=2 Tax=Marchantia polymorpha TaxID=3197 RepID=A0AAF6BA05_MARPO|nr:hypothetical protein MARPO_0119s0014 [Marchantia polymorpha]BBN08839.1 hypothetical protein Mp_4g14910 [Marchantia polymorpha subsp. ruderalis]|eukprot:PTQ30804.1 hypothetical protein MARPO_0119s0014 [Marchantia polymorpha]
MIKLKGILLSLCFFLLLASNVFAETDTDVDVGADPDDQTGFRYCFWPVCCCDLQQSILEMPKDLNSTHAEPDRCPYLCCCRAELDDAIDPHQNKSIVRIPASALISKVPVEVTPKFCLGCCCKKAYYLHSEHDI